MEYCIVKSGKINVHVCIQAERQSQQQWERELQERERRLKQQQEEAVGRLAGLEEMLHTRILAVEEVRYTLSAFHSVNLYFPAPFLLL